MQTTAITSVRTKIEAASLPMTLSVLLGLNTLVLLSLERVGGVPAWVKTAAALFLAF